MKIYKNLFEQGPSVHSDFSRLARFLTGTAIGVTLGGGGARGCAHVGIIKAILETGPCRSAVHLQRGAVAKVWLSNHA